MTVTCHVLRVGNLTVGCVSFYPSWWERIFLLRGEQERFCDRLPSVNGGYEWHWQDVRRGQPSRVTDRAVLHQLDAAIAIGDRVRRAFQK